MNPMKEKRIFGNNLTRRFVHHFQMNVEASPKRRSKNKMTKRRNTRQVLLITKETKATTHLNVRDRINRGDPGGCAKYDVRRFHVFDTGGNFITCRRSSKKKL